jgi:rubredoxin
MTRPKAMPEKVFQPAPAGIRYPTTGVVRTARSARSQISKRFEWIERNEMDDYKLFQCVQCGFEYDEARGWPEDGIAAGTRWDDIPEDWSCPDCGAAKSDFVMIEVARS